MKMSIKECKGLRGLAIILIVLHNYLHRIPGAISDNEFHWAFTRHQSYMDSLLSCHAVESIICYWGYLGVVAFVFLSGYGLSSKYGQQVSINYRAFVVRHYKKLVVPLILGSIAYQLMFIIETGKTLGSVAHTITQCTALLNILYPHGLYVFPGPYWYVGMALQLYFIYILFVYNRPPIVICILTFGCWLLMAFTTDDMLLNWYKHNAIGWMFPFTFGVLMAKKDFSFNFSKQMYLLIFVLLSIAITLMDGNYHTWLLIPIIAVIWNICQVKMLPDSVLRIFCLLGEYSMLLYFIHPVIRTLVSPIIMFWSLSGLLLYIVLTVVASYALHKLLTFGRSSCR